MKANFEWSDYEIIASGDGQKLERWRDIYLLRPDPQAIWQSKIDYEKFSKLNAKYNRIGGGGAWQMLTPLPNFWHVSWRNLTFQIKPMGFKHTGLFPEQAVNWAKMIDLIKNSISSKNISNTSSKDILATNSNNNLTASSEKLKENLIINANNSNISANNSNPTTQIKVLNLFAYTGGATVACTSAGAVVTHVDSAKNMIEIAKQNMTLSNLADKPVRYIVDDCKKFVQREIKRGNKYDAIIMDPPSYGRGPTGEVWKIEENLYELISLCKDLLSEHPLFFLVNSYTTGLQPTVMKNLLYRALDLNKNFLEKIDAYEVCLPTKEEIFLPCGCSALCVF